MIQVTPFITLDENELAFTFVRASGPGGQNVNKVSSACELRFDARTSPSLPADVAVRLMKLAGSKLTKEGVIIIFADGFRTQETNRQEAIDRLVAMIKQAAVRPKKRIATKPTQASKKRRLEGKVKRAGVKAMRGKPRVD
jgi:ribosome-associated protein